MSYEYTPKVVWIIVNYNNLMLTQQTVDSLLNNTEFDQYFIIIDNGSTEEGTHKWMDALVEPPKDICCHIIKNKDNLGFIGANNQGIEHALNCLSIDSIGIINNDVIVPPLAISNLLNRLYSSEDIAVVAPSTNYASGPQKVDWNVHASGRQQVETESVKYMLGNKGKWEETAYAIGMCMIMKKDFVQNIYDLNNKFFFDPCYGMGNYEDIHMVRQCICTLKKRVVIARDSFVYHYGSQTFNKDIEKFKGLLEKNEKIFRSKWDKKQKLVAGLCIKNEEKYIERVLASLETFVDEICILDDCSTDKTSELIKKYKKVVDIYKNEEGLERNEGRDRQRLLDMMSKRNPDWIVVCDGDELYEDEFIKNIQEICNPVDMFIDAYSLKCATFWRGEKDIRVDGIWGNQVAWRLYRHRPEYKTITDLKFHAPSIPVELPQDRRMSTGYRLKHYGYADYKECVKKYRFYTEKDKTKDPNWVGSAGYDHLVNEEKMILLNWVEDRISKKSISICMICKNESENIDKCMESAKKLGDEIIIIDTGSSDDSVEKLKAHGGKVQVYESEFFKKDTPSSSFDFSKARNESIKYATKDWIMFLDMDDTLEDEEIPELKKLLNGTPHVALQLQTRNVFGGTTDGLDDSNFAGSALNRIFRNHLGIKFEGIVHEDIVLPKYRTLSATRFKVYHWGYADATTVDKKVDRNLRLLNRQINKNKKDPLAYFHLAKTYLKKEDWQMVIKNHKNFLKCVKSNSPIIYSAYNDIAIALGKTGRWKDGVCIAYKAVAYANTMAASYNIIGDLFSDNNKWRNAEIAYSSALSLDPPTHETNPVDSMDYGHRPAFNLAKVCSHQRKYVSSIDYLKISLSYLPNKYSELIFKHLENLYKIMGDHKKANYYTRLLGMKKEDAISMLNKKGLENETDINNHS